MKGDENLVFTDDAILIKETMNTGEAVMHLGEKSLMQNLAQLVSKNGGHILEIGFGMHLSADEIQLNPNIKSHTIIEIHPEIYERALEWADTKHNVNIILGDWLEVIPKLDKKFNGILHDTHRDKNIHRFLDVIKPISDIDCIVGFFEYRFFDSRINAIRCDIKKNEFNSLPYRNNGTFENNQYELKYTTFNGTDFISSSKINKLL